METIGRIRRAHFVQKLSVREIACRLHVSRKTVCKAIETEESAFTYTRIAEPRPKLGRHAAALEQMLAENERKRRERRQVTACQRVFSQSKLDFPHFESGESHWGAG